ncbi:MAG: dihydroorotase, partial [Muribaculaceae bacterium]|nr:dihydroorotase [Muribaculaceae bacterium]
LWRIDRRGYLRRGYHADIAVVNPAAPHTIADADVVSRCGWTPYRGHTTRFAIEQTWVNGHLAFSAGEKNTPGVDHHAQPVCFNN